MEKKILRENFRKMGFVLPARKSSFSQHSQIETYIFLSLHPPAAFGTPTEENEQSLGGGAEKINPLSFSPFLRPYKGVFLFVSPFLLLLPLLYGA